MNTTVESDTEMEPIELSGYIYLMLSSGVFLKVKIGSGVCCDVTPTPLSSSHSPK